jgi:hypothetical protein
MAAGKYCRNQRCFGRAHLHLREGCPAGLLVSQGILEQRADQLLFGVRVQAKFAGQASRSMKGGWAQPADTRNTAEVSVGSDAASYPDQGRSAQSRG